MPKLTDAELDIARHDLPGWQLEDGKLVHDYKFPDFVAAMNFVNHIADMAESANHHPDIDIRYNQVRLALISHDSGGITNRDIRFATSVNVRFPA